MDKQKGFLEESLAESQGKDVCRAIFDGSPDAIFLADPKTGIVLDANPAAERLLGRPVKDIIGMHQTGLHPPKRETASRRIFKEHSASDGEPLSSGLEEHYALRADGTEIPVEITGSVIKIKGRKVLQGFFRDVSARKAAELALRESEEMYRTLVDHAPVGIVVHLGGRIVFLNSMMGNLSGLPDPSVLVGKSIMDFIHPESRPAAMKRLETMTRTGETLPPAEHKVVTPDGRILEMEMVAIPINYQGKSCFMSILQDITERKRVQQALQESEELYRTLVSHAPAGIVVHAMGVMRFVNARMAEIVRVQSPENVIGKNVLEFMHPDYRQFTKDRIAQGLKEGRPLPPADEKLLAADGTVVDVEIRSVPITYRGERCAMAIVQDITDRRHAQEALEESEARYRTLVDHAQVGIVVQKKGVVKFANRQMAEIVRVPDPALLVGRSALEFVHPDFTKAAKPHVNVGMIRRHPATEEKLIATDGTVVDAEIMTVPITYQGETCTLGIVVDITDRKKTEQALQAAHRKLLTANNELENRVSRRTAQLEELNKELEAFSYSAAHDLKAPLRRINIFSDMLEKEAGPVLAGENHEYLVNIHKSVSLMTKLVDGLLALSTTGRRPLTMEPVRLAELAREAVAEIQAENPGRAIEWKLPELPEVNCDRAMLRQVFVNLLGNAAKYSRGRDPAKVVVFFLKGEREHVIGVRDNGVGFSMENAEKIFGVFQRLHRSEDFEGTGIGLSLVKRIVSRHGGRVWAESEPGKGAVFCFSLPAQ